MDRTRRLISSMNTSYERILQQIKQEGMQVGCTIIFTFDPRSIGLSIALNDSSKVCFVHVHATTCSPLSDFVRSMVIMHI